MNILYIDLASHAGMIAAVTEKTVICQSPADHRIGDKELVPLIEDTLKQAGWKYQDLTHIACMSGPGGFTSLRVAVACANTFADQLHIPIAGIHLSDLCAAMTEGKNFVWLHSTKKNAVFVRGFGNITMWPEPQYILVEELTPQLPTGTLWTGELIEEHKTLMKKIGLMELEKLSLEEVLPTFLSQQTYNHTLIEPWYGRGW